LPSGRPSNSNQTAWTAADNVSLKGGQPRRGCSIGCEQPAVPIEPDAVAGRRCCARRAVDKQRRTIAAQTNHAGFVVADNRFKCLAARFALKKEIA
jgi:hypothetical protein